METIVGCVTYTTILYALIFILGIVGLYIVVKVLNQPPEMSEEEYDKRMAKYIED